jgi:plastocyanin
MKRLGLLLVLASLAGALPAEAAAPLGRVQVVAVEFHYRLSRVRVPAGQVRIELANFGQDEHNLTLRKVGTTKVMTIPGALPGTRETSTFRLRPGLYVLKCTMADHAMLGMKAQLRVVPRPQPRH